MSVLVSRREFQALTGRLGRKILKNLTWREECSCSTALQNFDVEVKQIMLGQTFIAALYALIHWKGLP